MDVVILTFRPRLLDPNMLNMLPRNAPSLFETILEAPVLLVIVYNLFKTLTL